MVARAAWYVQMSAWRLLSARRLAMTVTWSVQQLLLQPVRP